MGFFTSALIGLFALSGMNGTAALAFASGTIPLAPIQEQTLTVAMTGYNAVPEQTDGDPHTTASGAYSNPEVVAARSQDLAGELPFGTVISVTVSDAHSPNCGLGLVSEDIGLRVIADSMHYRKHDQIDILLPVEKTVRAGGRQVNPAVALGMCEDVEIRVVGMVDINHMPKSQTELRARIGYIQKADAQTLAIFK